MDSDPTYCFDVFCILPRLVRYSYPASSSREKQDRLLRVQRSCQTLWMIASRVPDSAPPAARTHSPIPAPTSLILPICPMVLSCVCDSELAGRAHRDGSAVNSSNS